MNPYKLSKDYERLFELVDRGNDIVCYVNYKLPMYRGKPVRDICEIRKKSYEYEFVTRGKSYGCAPLFEGLEGFLSECNRLKVKFIDPK